MEKSINYQTAKVLNYKMEKIINYEIKEQNLDDSNKKSEFINIYNKNNISQINIDRQLNFQELLINISAQYISSDLSDGDKLISESLQQIGEFLESDRSYIVSYDFVNNTSLNTYKCCTNGIDPKIVDFQNMPQSFITHLLDLHKKGEAFYIEDISQLTEDGEFGLRAIIEPQGIKSLIVIPQIKNNEIIGFIGFDSVKKINKYIDNDTKILFAFANMLTNLLQRKEQEQKKEELLRDLSFQNGQLNEYAHIVSNDLKAPLSNIHTLVGWFMDDNMSKFEEKDLYPLNQVLFNVEKIDFLAKGILNYSTVTKLEKQNTLIDFNTLIKDLLKTMLIPINTKLIIQDNLPSINGDAWRFEQVFQNLIQNAINYSDKDNETIEVGFTEKNDCYEFFVKDNGIGINSNYFDNVFKVFTKLESSGSSSGIGLSIVKKIICYYKGSIWLESQEGIGTTIYFTLNK